ncbi:MAG: DUF1080 domain-containing protein [Bacteroidales bacterium]|nr:DUF1080 domain-containing protein [Bacteroidales bacterium]
MKNLLIALGLIFLFVSCKEELKPTEKVNTGEAENLAQKQWTTLTGSDQWKGYNKDKLPENWKIEDDIIICFGKAGDVGGDIITKDMYDNFEFTLEWKISEGGNSGIFYHVIEDAQYHSPYQTGPEYQVLDDEGFPNKENLKEWQLAGADYAMYTVNDNKKLKPAGEWNKTRIIFNNKHVEHWLNGIKILEFDAWSDDWFERKANSKWNSMPHWGMAGSGHIGLQDHGADVWFRNVRVKKL